MHQRDAVAPLRFVHEMGGEEDRHAFIARQPDQVPPEPVAGDRVDARGRLVEDQHLGPMQDRDGKLKALLLARAAGFPAGCRRRRARSNRSSISWTRASRGPPAARTGGSGARGSAGRSARHRARRPATCSRRAARVAMSQASSGDREGAPRPSVGGSRPVSIFIVVLLPQPLDPRKPKISPRSMRKLTWSTAVNLPNRCVRPSASMAGGPSDVTARGDDDGLDGRRASRPAAG